MQVFVKSIDGETLTIEHDTVDGVKHKIEDLEGIPVLYQRLLFEGNELEDGRELSCYKVYDNSTLHLTMKLEGGESSSMQIFVVGLDGETLVVEVSGAEASVDELQQQVELVEGVPPELQRLAFQGAQLQRGRSLRHYGVIHHSTLHLTMDLDGGRVLAGMQIFVVGLDGESFPVEVCGEDVSVEEVQRQVELLEGVPPEQQRLSFQGAELRRSHTLRHYRVREHSTLHLTVNLDGGSSRMQVFVVGLDGETFPVEVCGVEARVEEVQRQVELVEGVPPELQRLTFQGRELQRGCALRDYNVTEHSSLHLTMDLDGGRDQYNWLKYIATKALTHKKICRKCYGRLSPNATRCHKAKCGRTSDIRPKKLPFMRRYWYNLNRPYTDACRWGW